jgi:hypothetical protein
MKTIFRALAVSFLVSGVVFLLMNNYDRAFLAAASGAIAQLLSYRAQLKEKLALNEANERKAIEQNANEEDL